MSETDRVGKPKQTENQEDMKATAHASSEKRLRFYYGSLSESYVRNCTTK